MKILPALLLLIPISSIAQSKFEITGNSAYSYSHDEVRDDFGRTYHGWDNALCHHESLNITRIYGRNNLGLGISASLRNDGVISTVYLIGGKRWNIKHAGFYTNINLGGCFAKDFAGATLGFQTGFNIFFNKHFGFNTEVATQFGSKYLKDMPEIFIQKLGIGLCYRF